MAAVFTAASVEGRILLGLRAGEMDTTACYERFPGFSSLIGRLARAGLVARGDDSYRLTDAGRAACPFRNPRAATPAAPAPIKEIQPMPATACLTTAKVLDRIIAAGPSGISPSSLAAQFGVGNKGIYYHIKGMGAAVLKTRGLVVAAGFVRPEIPAEVAAEAEKIAQEYAEMIDFEIEPAIEEPSRDAMANHDVTSGSPVAEAGKQARLKAERLFPEAPEFAAVAEAAAERVARRARDLPAYLDIDDPDQVEIAIFSSGGMDIYFDDNTIALSGPVLAKLRAFLGVSQRGR